MQKADFFNQFDFNPSKEGFVGIERERFLKKSGEYSPESDWFLEQSRALTRSEDIWTAELSRCQIEDRTTPKSKLVDIYDQLNKNDKEGRRIARECSLELSIEEVAAKEIPLSVYPQTRYRKIKKDLSKDVLRAACRVTGTHLHLGVANMDQAISVHNKLQNSLKYFTDLGDHSEGRRLKLYKKVAADPKPPNYRDKEHFFRTAKKQGFASNPRNCWHLLRISVHGTVELRMFGSTGDLDEIISWTEKVREKAGL